MRKGIRRRRAWKWGRTQRETEVGERRSWGGSDSCPPRGRLPCPFQQPLITAPVTARAWVAATAPAVHHCPGLLPSWHPLHGQVLHLHGSSPLRPTVTPHTAPTARLPWPDHLGSGPGSADRLCDPVQTALHLWVSSRRGRNEVGQGLAGPPPSPLCLSRLAGEAGAAEKGPEVRSLLQLLW